MATNPIHTTNEMKQDIVCPLTLKIAIASEGRLGAIQSYRCQPKPNIGGWETRPQKDKWASDFFKVLNAKKDEMVTLSDGETKMRGLDQPSDTRFLFTHEDGVRARNIAMQYVLQGKLRAPRNWDKVWATNSEMSLDELKRTYPELYQTQTRNNNNDEEEKQIEALDEGFLEGIEENPQSLTVEEHQALDSEEQTGAFEEEHEPSYSVVSELGLEEQESAQGFDLEHYDSPQEITIKRTGAGTTIHHACEWIRADMGDEEGFVYFYKVKNPNTGEYIWLHEGMNECFANINLTVQSK